MSKNNKDNEIIEEDILTALRNYNPENNNDIFFEPPIEDYDFEPPIEDYDFEPPIEDYDFEPPIEDFEETNNPIANETEKKIEGNSTIMELQTKDISSVFNFAKHLKEVENIKEWEDYLKVSSNSNDKEIELSALFPTKIVSKTLQDVLNRNNVKDRYKELFNEEFQTIEEFQIILNKKLEDKKFKDSFFDLVEKIKQSNIEEDIKKINNYHLEKNIKEELFLIERLKKIFNEKNLEFLYKKDFDNNRKIELIKKINIQENLKKDILKKLKTYENTNAYKKFEAELNKNIFKNINDDNFNINEVTSIKYFEIFKNFKNELKKESNVFLDEADNSFILKEGIKKLNELDEDIDCLKTVEKIQLIKKQANNHQELQKIIEEKARRVETLSKIKKSSKQIEEDFLNLSETQNNIEEFEKSTTNWFKKAGVFTAKFGAKSLLNIATGGVSGLVFQGMAAHKAYKYIKNLSKEEKQQKIDKIKNKLKSKGLIGTVAAIGVVAGALTVLDADEVLEKFISSSDDVETQIDNLGEDYIYDINEIITQETNNGETTAQETNNGGIDNNFIEKEQINTPNSEEITKEVKNNTEIKDLEENTTNYEERSIKFGDTISGFTNEINKELGLKGIDRLTYEEIAMYHNLNNGTPVIGDVDKIYAGQKIILPTTEAEILKLRETIQGKIDVAINNSTIPNMQDIYSKEMPISSLENNSPSTESVVFLKPDNIFHQMQLNMEEIQSIEKNISQLENQLEEKRIIEENLQTLKEEYENSQNFPNEIRESIQIRIEETNKELSNIIGVEEELKALEKQIVDLNNKNENLITSIQTNYTSETTKAILEVYNGSRDGLSTIPPSTFITTNNIGIDTTNNIDTASNIKPKTQEFNFPKMG